MNHFLGLLLIGLSVYLPANSANDLNVSLIPDTLLVNANAVYRFHHTDYERSSLAKLTQKVHYAITILNKKGEEHAELVVFYDKLSQIISIKGGIYGANGTNIKQFDKSDIKDESAFASFTLYSDSRVKYISPIHNTYPYTVEYAYEIVYNGVVGIDTWAPIPSYGLSVQQAELHYSTPADISVKYKAVNGDFKFAKYQEKNINHYTWKTQHLTAYTNEPLTPPFGKIAPLLLLSPDEFEYDKTKGDFRTWETYGKWAYSLLNGRDKLPETAAADIAQLIAGVTDKKEQAKRIYQYMQGRTRYVSIALGIGGFQPISAQEVHKYGYGDCKALSNYTKSLLKLAGIESYYTEIGHGLKQQINQTDFASANQANHVILCLPIEKDTLWLECTSQKAPFGYIGSGNADRYALAITPQGGKLVRTPSYTAQENLEALRVANSIQPNGDLSFSASLLLTNLAYTDASGLLTYSPKEQKEIMVKSLPLNNLSISNLTITDKSSTTTAAATLNFSGNAAKYASSVGNRLFVPVSPFHKTSQSFPANKERANDIFIETGSTQTDTLTFSIPPEYEIEFLPDDFNTTSVIGTYSAKFKKSDSQIQFIRTLVLNKGTFPRSNYPDIYNFYNLVSDCDNKKFILKKQ